VTSFNSPPSPTPPKGGKGDKKGRSKAGKQGGGPEAGGGAGPGSSSSSHLAVNYWFHPPDNLGSSSGSEPYTSDFWCARGWVLCCVWCARVF